MHAQPWIALVLLATAVAVTSPAYGCPEDGDLDGVCDADDNCPVISNLGQEDLDGDAEGDACDPADAPLSPIRLRMRRDTSGQGDNSLVKARGTFVTDPPADVFDATAGFAIRVRDALGLDTTVTFETADCVAVPGRVKCRRDGKALQATFKTLGAVPEAQDFTLVLRRLGLAGPFDGPIQLTITQTGTDVDRDGTISDCVLKLTGISCREP